MHSKGVITVARKIDNDILDGTTTIALGRDEVVCIVGADGKTYGLGIDGAGRTYVTLREFKGDLAIVGSSTNRVFVKAI